MSDDIIVRIPAETEARGWFKMPFVGKNGIGGTLFYTSSNIDAAELRVPLPARGVYRIWLGMSSNANWSGMLFGIGVRLAGEPCCSYVANEGTNWFNELEESYWRTARLDNDVLVISQHFEKSTSIAYIRLEQVSELDLPESPCEGGRLVVTNDGFEVHTWDSLKATIMPWADHPACDVFFCVAEGEKSPFYKASLGETCRRVQIDDKTFCQRKLDYEIEDSLARMREEHPAVLKDFVAFAHSLHLGFHLSYRTGACHYKPDLSVPLEAGLLDRHPEYRACRRDGVPYARWSFAVPEVQEYLTRLYMEIFDGAGEADGINLIFIRSMPLTGFEPAFVNRFQDAYGMSPLGLADDDERILALRSDIATEWLRILRRELDAREAKASRHLELTAFVPSTPERSRFFGLDVARWAREELLDRVMISDSAQVATHREAYADMDLEGYARLLRGTTCAFYSQALTQGIDVPRNMAAVDFFRRGRKAGIAGIYMWDAHTIPQKMLTLGKLFADGTGDKAEMFLAAHPELHRIVGFETVDGEDYSDLPPHLAF